MFATNDKYIVILNNKIPNCIKFFKKKKSLNTKKIKIEGSKEFKF